jgi:aspartyl-tRNA(Asn)/glutamyl-tRNA(Gln) amidotransferase subunit A
VVGLKPAFGHVSTAGVFPLAESLDHVGLLDGRHAQRRRRVGRPRPRGRAPEGAFRRPGVVGVRVGVPVDDYWQPVDPVIAEGVAAAVAALEKAGAQIVEVRTPMIDELAATYPRIVGAEAYATHAAWLAERPGDYQPLVRERLLSFADQPAKDYIDASAPAVAWSRRCARRSGRSTCWCCRRPGCGRRRSAWRRWTACRCGPRCWR